MLFYAVFQTKSKRIHLSVVLFRVSLVARGLTVYDSQATKRSAQRGGGLSESTPCLLLVAWESYVTPSRTVAPVYVAGCIRVNHHLQLGCLSWPGLCNNDFFFIFLTYANLLHRYTVTLNRIFNFSKLWAHGIHEALPADHVLKIRPLYILH
jgi:hypothetical protein